MPRDPQPEEEDVPALEECPCIEALGIQNCLCHFVKCALCRGVHRSALFDWQQRCQCIQWQFCRICKQRFYIKVATGARKPCACADQ